jgi:hypothetical protein
MSTCVSMWLTSVSHTVCGQNPTTGLLGVRK